VVVLGLVCFGLGMAAIYCGAIYYAMEVGSAEVEAGGAHEALIGVGYTAGPLCGLAAGALVSFGLIPEYRLEPVLLAGVGGIAVLVAIATARRVALQTRQTRSSPLPAA
jgi:MFS family permease